MKKYQNLNGNSGVLAYEIEAEAIQVKFSEDKIYRYSYSIAGKEHIENMKVLAEAGKGLSTYISRNVKGNYEK